MARQFPKFESHRIPALALGLFLATLTTASAVSIDDFEPRVYDPDNDPGTFNMSNRLYIPENTEPGEKYPLIIYLHGLGSGNGDNVSQLENHGHGGMYFAEDEQQAIQPSFVLLPQEPGGTTEHWHQGEVKQLLMGLIDSVLNEFPNIDQDRIYIGGISMGGAGTWSQLTTQPEKYAASFILAGAGGSGGASNVDHIPIWQWHSVADGVVGEGSSRSRARALRNLGAPHIYTEFISFGHVIGPKVCSVLEFYEWLVEQKRGEAMQAAPLLRITEYAVGDSLDISGFALDEATGATQVDWYRGDVAPSSGAPITGPVNLDTPDPDSGEQPWSVEGVSLESGSNLINIIATSGPYAIGDPDGATTFSQAVTIDFSVPAGDATPPLLTVNAPTHSDFSLRTELSELTFSGTASDAGGLAAVTWSTDRGQSGSATGLADWSADIPLEMGFNLTTISVTDTAGNSRSQVFYLYRVAPAENTTPFVRAGPDLLLPGPEGIAELDGSAGDDGLPVSATYTWTKISGPGTVTFEDSNALDTTATFSEPGDYVLRLTGDDTEKTAFDETTVTVPEEAHPAFGPGLLGVNCNGDAFTATDGTEYVSDRDANYLFGGGSWDSGTVMAGTEDQEIYQTAIVPRGSSIWNIPFPNGHYIVTLKTVTPRPFEGERLADFYIEEKRVLHDLDVLDYVPRYTALDFSFPVTVSDGKLTVRLHQRRDDFLLCGILIQEAVIGPQANQPPIVELIDEVTVTLAEGASLSSFIIDDGRAPGTATPNILWKKEKGSGKVRFNNPAGADTDATFSKAGVYELKVSASDGEYETSDTVIVNVLHRPPTAPGLTVRFDFGTQSIPTSETWNLVQQPLDHVVLNAEDTSGSPTSFDLKITGSFRGRNTTGPEDTGLYPNEATYDSFYADDNRHGGVTFEDLDPGRTYDIILFAAAASGAGMGQYSIDTVTKTFDAIGNTTSTIQFSELNPDPSGSLVLSVIPAEAGQNAYINTLILVEKNEVTLDYDGWIPDFFPGQTGNDDYVGPLADPDSDGLSNYTEYSLGTNPSVSNKNTVAGTASDGRLAITFLRPNSSDITYTVEVSGSLAPDSWEAIATRPAGSSEWTGSAEVMETGDGLVEVTVTDQHALSDLDKVRFIRLNLTGLNP